MSRPHTCPPQGRPRLHLWSDAFSRRLCDTANVFGTANGQAECDGKADQLKPNAIRSPPIHSSEQVEIDGQREIPPSDATGLDDEGGHKMGTTWAQYGVIANPGFTHT